MGLLLKTKLKGRRGPCLDHLLQKVRWKKNNTGQRLREEGWGGRERESKAEGERGKRERGREKKRGRESKESLGQPDQRWISF